MLTGEIRACDRLVVEGRVEAALTDSRSIEIAATGMFKGKAQIDTAEISGRFEGDLIVNHKLTIHSSGRVTGNIRYGQIEIARGGVISGQIDVLAGAAILRLTAHGAIDGETADMLPDQPRRSTASRRRRVITAMRVGGRIGAFRTTAIMVLSLCRRRRGTASRRRAIRLGPAAFGGFRARCPAGRLHPHRGRSARRQSQRSSAGWASPAWCARTIPPRSGSTATRAACWMSISIPSRRLTVAHAEARAQNILAIPDPCLAALSESPHRPMGS